MRIGQLARKAGCSVETLRYYEQRGLIPAPYRSASNYRYYGGDAVERVCFIRRCRDLDMTLDEIQQLLAIRDEPATACASVNQVVDAHLQHVSDRLAELQALKADLEQIQRQCNHDGTAADCGILQELQESEGGGGLKPGHIPGAHGEIS
ncbi:Cd(II)/Pb(II)-responsive transcriptional regulator [Marinobacteraceae bacterium S3BR75-40.1]